MKKLNLIFTITMMFNLGLMSQNYVPFPTTNASWRVFREAEMIGDPKNTFVLNYVLTGADTTINSTQYKILTEYNLTFNYSQFAGGIREENKKIYYYFPLEEYEYLLYDFNVNKGDTVKIGSSILYIVLDIDSIDIDGSYRKRYKINDMHGIMPDYLIEGIGSVKNSLIYAFHPIPTCTCVDYWEHICFEQNGIVKYLNPNFSDCSSTEPKVKLNEINIGAFFRIYPNPVDKEIFIENNSNSKKYKIKIIDSEGRNVFEKELTESTTRFDLACKTGLYNALILNHNGQILESIKIIKK